jgi:hypothetical protein
MEPFVWTEEDYVRHENEVENCVELLDAVLRDQTLLDWLRNNEAARYSPDIAQGIQQVIIADFEANLQSARVALRNLAALAEEARVAASNGMVDK